MEIKIREALINEYEGLCEVYDELDKFHRLNHPELFIKPKDYARTKEYISETINDSDKALFVADVDSKVIGIAECCLQRSSSFPVFRERAWIQLDSLVVKEEYQNHHIGSLLLKKVEEWAKSKRITRIELKVYSFNDQGIEFYLEKGFKDLSKTMFLDL